MSETNLEQNPIPDPVPEIKPAHHLPIKYWLPAIIAAALLAGVGIFYLAASFDKDLSSEVSVSDSQQMMHKDAVEFKDWKTYEDKTQGFEFQYPNGWSVKNSTPDVLLITNDTNRGQLMQISVSDLSNAKTIEEWLKQRYKGEMEISESNIVYITFPSSGMKFAQLRGVPGESSDNMASYIIHGDKVISIIVSPVSTLERSYINLVGSFKFIEPTDITGWKTYRNDKYGFELQYPEDYAVQEHSYGSDFQVFFESDNNNFQLNFKNNALNSSTPLEQYYYLDYNPSKKVTLATQVAYQYDAPQGYCDGPGCTPPFIAVATDHTSDVYVLHFSGDAKIDQTEQKIIDSFKFTK